MSVLIPLTKGYETLVDESDLDRVSRHSWCADVRKSGAVYAVARIMNKKTYLHRFIIGEPCVSVDHANVNTLDNRRLNLRVAGASKNGANKRSVRVDKNYKGVYFHKSTGKWASQITSMYRHYYLGLFEDPIEAAMEYDMAAKSLFGSYARTNFYGE